MGSPSSRLLLLLLLLRKRRFAKRAVQLVEDPEAFDEPLRVGRNPCEQTGEDLLDTGRFQAPEFSVLEIDVVDDLGNFGDAAVANAGSKEQRLERATVPLVREIAADDVERDLSGTGGSQTCLAAEARGGKDETAGGTRRGGVRAFL